MPPTTISFDDLWTSLISSNAKSRQAAADALCDLITDGDQSTQVRDEALGCFADWSANVHDGSQLPNAIKLLNAIETVIDDPRLSDESQSSVHDLLQLGNWPPTLEERVLDLLIDKLRALPPFLPFGGLKPAQRAKAHQILLDELRSSDPSRRRLALSDFGRSIYALNHESLHLIADTIDSDPDLETRTAAAKLFQHTNGVTPVESNVAAKVIEPIQHRLLIAVETSGDRGVRLHLARSFGDLGVDDPRIIAALERVAANDSDRGVRTGATEALNRLVPGRRERKSKERARQCRLASAKK